MLDGTSSQASKFGTKNWFEINDDSRGLTWKTATVKLDWNLIRKSSLCDYNDSCIFVEGTISVANTAAAGAAGNKNDVEVIFKHWTPFTDCMSEIENTLIDNAKKLIS